MSFFASLRIQPVLAGRSRVSALILAIHLGEFLSQAMGSLAKLTAEMDCDRRAKCHVPPFQITPMHHPRLLHKKGHCHKTQASHTIEKNLGRVWR